MKKKGGPALTPLAGDASTRHYFRYESANGPRILCRYPNLSQLQRFVNANHLYRALELPVPRLISIRPRELEIVQNDLGDETLEKALAANDPAAAACPEGTLSAHQNAQAALCAQAVDFLAVLAPAAKRVEYELPQPLFARGRFEMNFFLAKFVAHHLVAKNAVAKNGTGSPPRTPITKLRSELRDLLRRIDRLPAVLCHRDYHRRNLMVTRRGGKPQLVIIDHQDTRLGPAHYDLASFLYDSYGTFPARQRTLLAGRLGADLADPAFRLPALQRSLKALGTFGVHVYEKKNSYYAQAIPITLRHTREHLAVLATSGIHFPHLAIYFAER